MIKMGWAPTEDRLMDIKPTKYVHYMVSQDYTCVSQIIRYETLMSIADIPSVSTVLPFMAIMHKDVYKLVLSDRITDIPMKGHKPTIEECLDAADKLIQEMCKWIPLTARNIMMRLIELPTYNAHKQFAYDQQMMVMMTRANPDVLKHLTINRIRAGIVHESLKAKPSLISTIFNPSEMMQLIAVGECPSNIRMIARPTQQVQLMAVMAQGSAIKYINAPSMEVQIAAVKQDAKAIEFIIDPCEEAIALANGEASTIKRIMRNPLAGFKKLFGKLKKD
jgi:hypothetical protein